jgi:hypothetical protein
MFRLQRPVSPVLFREIQKHKLLLATIRSDETHQAVIDWGKAPYEFVKLPAGQRLNPDALPIAGAIVLLDGDFAFLDSHELAIKTAVALAEEAATKIAYDAQIAAQQEREAAEKKRRKTANAALNLPFAWHPAYKPTLSSCYEGKRTNGSGAIASTVSHVLLDEPFRRGRLHRDTSTFLCGVPPASNGSGIVHESVERTIIDCRTCLKIIARLNQH